MIPERTNGRGKSQGLQGMVVLSFLLHFLFLSIFLFSPSLPTKKLTFGPAYSVDLVSAPAGAADMKPMASISKELSTPTSKQEVLNLKKPEESRPIPLLKQSTPRKENAEREKAIEDLKRRLAASSQSSAKASQSQAAQAAPAAAAARGDGAAIDPRLAAYYTRIKARVMSQWALPRGVLPEHKLLAVLNVVILRDGTVARLSFERSSGNRFYDQSAERAVRKASPFPPLPETIKGSSLEIGLTFP